MRNLLDKIKETCEDVGMKVCGAGGGGCFLITHKAQDKEKVQSIVDNVGMTNLDFKIEKPL